MRSRIHRFGVALILVCTGFFALSATASAASSCQEQVLADWSDNGRVDRVYPLDCYAGAVESLPPEIRDYSDATEVIDRALTLAVRRQSGSSEGARPAPLPSAANVAQSSGATAIPPQLFVLGAVALGMLAAGAVAYGARRARLGRAKPPR